MDQTFAARIAGRIETLVMDFGAGRGIFPVDVVVRGRRPNLVIEVYIDGDAGIDTDACAQLNRALNQALDADILTGEPYTLTVSSPGIERALKFPRQYPKHAGRRVSIAYRTGGATTRISGVLASAGELSILVRTDGGTGKNRTGTAVDVEIPYGEIVEARVEPRW